MSGFEVIAAVTAIIGAFNGSLTLFRDWSEKRRERREHAENRRLEQSLILGGSAVQTEYDSDFARLGRKFGIGDKRGRAELPSYLIKLEHGMISLLIGENPAAIILPNLPAIYSTLEETRIGVITALREQFQRMSETMMLPRPLNRGIHSEAGTREKIETICDSQDETLASTSTGFKIQSGTASKEDKKLQLVRRAPDMKEFAKATGNQLKAAVGAMAEVMILSPSRICGGHLRYHAGVSVGVRSCVREGCGFTVTRQHSDLCYSIFRTRNGIKVGVDCAPLWESHTAGNAIQFRCRVCWTSEVFYWEELLAHLADKHTRSELLRTFGSDVNYCYCPEGESCQKDCIARMHAEEKREREWKRSQPGCVVS